MSRYFIDDDGRPVHHCDIPEQQLPLFLQQLGSIVLLLESTHTEEYEYGNIDCPIAPAKGSTGTNIHKFLGAVLSDMRENLIVPGSHVIISNPIQFQTSLYAIHGQSAQDDSRWATLRNNVWRALWYGGEEGRICKRGRRKYIQLCFRARLMTYKPKLIINACTYDLKSHVTRLVRAELPEVTLYKAHHPSIKWSSCNNTGLELIYSPPDPNACNPQH